ncbi:MAG TPA: glycosyltransferase family 2 protein [Chitinophagaceae bacterium]|nr:glycosyltransferase family 2 protein [Chitinophagaceae bacterium]
MLLSIIIVHYKTPRLLEDCLRSLYAHRGGANWEILVVDNASGDDSRAFIASAFPEVSWIQMAYNSGFARANNEGIRVAKGEAVLLLNSDTLAEDDAIARCCHFLANAPAYAACGVQLLNPDRTPQISGNYAMRGGLNYLLPLPYTGALLKWLATGAGVQKPNVPEAKGEVEVDWINGAFLMVKKTAIAKAGLMDEDFFLYAEEAEWCSRLKKTGKLCILGNLHIIHLQGETANESFGSEGKGYFNLFDRKGLQIMISNIVRIRKEFGAGWFLFHLLAHTLEIPVFFWGLLLKPFSPGSTYTWAKWRGYCRNVGVLWSKSMTILRNRPYFYKFL